MASMFGLNTQDSGLVGLDIGSYSVKAVSLHRQAGRYRLGALASARVAEPDPNGSSPDPMVTAVGQCLREIRAPQARVVCAVGGPDVTVRSFKFPPLPASEVPGAVRLEATQVCPFSLDQSTLAYQVVTAAAADRMPLPPQKDKAGTSGAPVMGLLAAATNASVSHKRGVAAEAGASCVLMDVDALALLNGITGLQDGEPAPGLTVLDVGHRHSTLTILPASGLPFVRDIPFGGRAVLELLSKHTGVAVTEVLQALHSTGKRGPNQAVERGLKAACGPLAKEVLGTLRYFDTQEPGHPLAKILVCGGFAQTAGFPDRLGELLGSYEVCIWNPLERLDCGEIGKQPGLLDRGPAFAVAVGLAMRSL